jgi:hypothetical protein
MRKIAKLKKWLTLEEAAQIASAMLDEEVKEADLLRLTLEGHLKLSIRFLTEIMAAHGKPMTDEEADNQLFKSPGVGLFQSLRSMTNSPPGKHFNRKDGLRIDTIRGVWDFSMIGDEVNYIESQYQRLIGGPEITPKYQSGVYVENEHGWLMCQLLEKSEGANWRFDSCNYKELQERIVVENLDKSKAKRLLEDYDNAWEDFVMEREWHVVSEEEYFSTEKLPTDIMLVVRTRALNELITKLLDGEEDLNNNQGANEKTPQATKAKNSMLKVIGGFVQMHYLGDSKRGAYLFGEKPNIKAIAEHYNNRLAQAGFNDNGIKDTSLRKLIKVSLEQIAENKEE